MCNINKLKIKYNINDINSNNSEHKIHVHIRAAN